MKRRPLLFAISFILVLGVALWGVNYRLKHPPLSDADKEFRALVAGADSVEIIRWNSKEPLTQYKPLDARQTKELLKHLRFSDQMGESSGIPSFELQFLRQGKTLLWAKLFQQSGSATLLTASTTPWHEYKLHPLFAKRLNLFLDQVPTPRKFP